MIGIIDSGAGNIGSLVRIFNELSSTHKIIRKPCDFENIEKLILPGVGSFDSAISSLTDSGLHSIIINKVLKENLPILGICLGMQLLFNRSAEGKKEGFGFIDGSVNKLEWDRNHKLPHVGWNNILIKRNSPITKGLSDDSYFYFTHSFGCFCDNSEDILCESEYLGKFASIVQKNNIFGVQFHPEKSHESGRILIKNFVEF